MINVTALTEAVSKMGRLFSNASGDQPDPHHRHTHRHQQLTAVVTVLLIVSLTTLTGVAWCARALWSERANLRRQRAELTADPADEDNEDDGALDELAVDPPLDALPAAQTNRTYAGPSVCKK